LHQYLQIQQENVMTIQDALRADTRLGFHYFPDSRHYREVDLHAWVPEIKAMGGSWLTMIAPNDRAIPEEFLRGVMREYIEPVLHFRLPVDRPADPDNLELLLHSYADWGVRYITLFDRPNLRANWSASNWVRNDLVERFLDSFIPAANLTLQHGLAPVFPPLEPGGDYWDTAFLRGALQGILRRGQEKLAENLILGAYAWVNKHPLTWGAGGPERWPQSRPYHTPDGQEDQRGFYIFDWYLAIAQAALGTPRPVILLGAGYNPFPKPRRSMKLDEEQHTKINLALRLAMQDPGTTPAEAVPPAPPHVLACNFWLLAADETSPECSLAWFRPDGSALPAVEGFKNKGEINHAKSMPGMFSPSMRPIAHYVLLPSSGANLPEILARLAPWVEANHPTVGFSIEEAALAARVSVLAGEEHFPDEMLESLRTAGCSVERLEGNGISIATGSSSNQTQPM
jgi:hypothetical protein